MSIYSDKLVHMNINFTKMHGLGNDFMVIDAIHQKLSLTDSIVRQLADRRRGVGFDQLLVVEPATQPGIDFTYRIFNADGAEVGQCGNGARCFARFVTDKELINKDNITVMTKSGLLELHLEKDEMIRVNMGKPDFEPKNIPFEAKMRSSSYNLDIQGKEYSVSVVSIGNPHAVLIVNDCAKAPVNEIGPVIQDLALFPEGVNVGFMQILNADEISLRVYERGAGETQACGSGACAAMVCGRNLGKLNQDVTVHLHGGDLKINWEHETAPVYMTGTATSVYEGQISL